ncbi:MAG: hypothetical protein ACM3RP_03430 [Chitinophagales bacterium]
MKRVMLGLVVLGILIALSVPVSAAIDWCGGGTPPGLGAKDDETHPAFAQVEKNAGFSLHDVNPFSGNSAKTTAAADHNPVDPGSLPADATLGPHK